MLLIKHHSFWHVWWQDFWQPLISQTCSASNPCIWLSRKKHFLETLFNLLLQIPFLRVSTWLLINNSSICYWTNGWKVTHFAWHLLWQGPLYWGNLDFCDYQNKHVVDFVMITLILSFLSQGRTKCLRYVVVLCKKITSLMILGLVYFGPIATLLELTQQSTHCLC